MDDASKINNLLMKMIVIFSVIILVVLSKKTLNLNYFQNSEKAVNMIYVRFIKSVSKCPKLL